MNLQYYEFAILWIYNKFWQRCWNGKVSQSRWKPNTKSIEWGFMFKSVVASLCELKVIVDYMFEAWLCMWICDPNNYKSRLRVQKHCGCFWVELLATPNIQFGQGVVFLDVSSAVQSSMVKIDVTFSIPTYNRKEETSILFYIFLSAEKRWLLWRSVLQSV